MEQKERMKEEAIRRLKMLRVHPNVIRDFVEENKLNYSENGILFWVDNNREWADRVSKWQEKSECMVYHVIYNRTKSGEFLTLLFVSKYEEDWEIETKGLKEGFPEAYVINLDDDFCSEMGTVGIAMRYGGVVRIH